MSITVQVDYEQIAIHCESICEVAQKQLEEMDKMIDELTATSQSLMNVQTDTLLRNVQKERESLIRQMNLVKSKAEQEAKQGTVSINNHDARYESIMAHKEDTVNEAKRLQQQADELASKKLVEMRALLDAILTDRIAENTRKLHDKATGAVRMDASIRQLLDAISDETLRQFTYLAFLQNPSLGGDELREAGKAMMKEGVADRFEKEAERIRKELEASRINKETVDKIVKPGTTIEEIRKTATAEIVGEKIRQKSLKIIMKAVSDRGFIVDKQNIRINREDNAVTMIAQKASGEQAEFHVFLDGKFIYDFHNGYKGQACQKDSEPFMKALEEVYGMHIKETKEIWSNPDKISTMKYQAMNSNKNRG